MDIYMHRHTRCAEWKYTHRPAEYIHIKKNPRLIHLCVNERVFYFFTQKNLNKWKQTRDENTSLACERANERVSDRMCEQSKL